MQTKTDKAMKATNPIDLLKELGEIIKVQTDETLIEKLQTSKEKASLIVMSHLSDAQESNIKANANLNVNFAKFIILQCKGDLNQLIDADEMWERYLNRKG